MLVKRLANLFHVLIYTKAFAHANKK